METSQMSTTIIEDLNKDVLLEIFEYLDSKSLKKAAEVCTQWDSIIGSSTSIMRKLPLVFRLNWEQKKDEIKGLCRKFHSIIIEVNVNDQKLKKVLEKVAGQARYFEIDEVEIKQNLLMDLLSCLKTVEKLVVKDVSLGDSTVKSKCKPPDLSSLKTLIFLQSDSLFLDFLTECNAQLSELKICETAYDMDGAKCLEKFIAKQSKLETLCIRVHNGDMLKSLAKSQGQFKLKKLAIDFKHWGDDPSADDDFIEFLKVHKETLQELEIKRNISGAVVEFIMKHLKLRRLIIDVNRLPVRPLFYNAIRPNQYLKTLVIKGSLDQIDVVRGLLHVYKGIDKLVIANWSDEVINESLIFIANNLTRLSYLEIPGLTADTPELPIPSLKTFFVDFVGDAGEYQTFCMCNPSIEKLIVKWTTARNIFTYEIINNIIRGLHNLKHMKFGAYFNPSQRILDMISQSCQSLRTLEILEEEPRNRAKPNFIIGRLMVRYYSNDAVSSIFKDVENSLWMDRDFSDIESNFDSDLDDSEDDDDIMDWDADSDLDENDEFGDDIDDFPVDYNVFPDWNPFFF